MKSDSYAAISTPLAAVLAAVMALGVGCDVSTSTTGVSSPTPEPSPAKTELRLSAISGNGQTVMVNEAIPDPLVVQVVTDTGMPVANVPVAFAFANRAGQRVRKSVTTDATGQAKTTIVAKTFGHLPVTASLPDQPGNAAVEFRLTATGWISTIAGDGIQGFGGDGGPAADCQMNGPFGMVQDDDGNIIFVDWYSNRIRKINHRTGLISTVAGQGFFRSDGDGGLAIDANMNGPYALKRDAAGNLFVSDYFSGRIRRIAADSGIITTVAGNGIHANQGDGGPAPKAAIDVPLDIAVDPAGNIYLSDWHRSVIRKVAAKTGRITTIAGSRRLKRGYNGDNRPATSARLNQPLGLATDMDGNLFIADFANHRIRKVDARSRSITTVAGNGEKGFSGDGGPATAARLRNPYNLTVDATGNLYLADAENHRIRKVDATTGIITTIAGNGSPGFAGDGGWATEASFNGLFSLTLTDAGELLVADYFNNRIRKIGFTKPKPRDPESGDRQLIRQARQLFGALPNRAKAKPDSIPAHQIVLGRQLFHEVRLSKEKDISCRTCHDLERYGIDGRKVAVGHRKQAGTRNAPSVFNAAQQEALFWDGRAPTIEEQAKFPIFNPIEMAMESEKEVVRRLGSVPEYPPLFRAAFPAEKAPISVRNITRAIGAFERGLLTPGAFDDFVRGDATALSRREKEGLRIFLREGCASCHFGPLLGGVKLALRKPYPSEKYGFGYEFRKYFGDEYSFKVPQLRNIAQTGPYLHDGSATSLKEALSERLRAYQYGEAQTMIKVTFAEGELETLTDFLKSLTGRIDPEQIAEPAALSGGG
jgi:cytochrome c peroxidase/sugar lactone lactonase YvrE